MNIAISRIRDIPPWLRLMIVLVIAIAVAALTIHVAARRAGESFAAHALRRIYMPLAGFKANMASPQAFARLIAKERAAGGDAPPPSRLAAAFDVRRDKAAGYDAYVVTPRGGTPRRTIVYIHGGAYVGNLSRYQWQLVEGLATQSDATVIVPLYPLAPEHHWRDGYAALEALYAAVTARHPARDVTLAGDSAGGGLALGLAQHLRDTERPVPGHLVLLSPWLDLTLDNPRHEALSARDPILATPGLDWGATQWAGGTALTDPHVSPLFGSLRGLPPIFLSSGTADLLHPDAQALVAKAGREGTRLTYSEGRNMTHAWSVTPIPEAYRLYARIGAFLEEF